MKYLIIDDEPIARKGIRLLADQVPWLEYLGEFPNPILAQDYIKSSKDLDLIFLDIEMPGITGIQFLRDMRPDAAVILTTAYSQYGVEAYELDVIDYLLKPVSMSRFLKAVQKAKEMSQAELTESDIKESEQIIYIKADRKFIKLSFADLLYIKGHKDYVMIHTKDKKYMTAMNIGTIFNQLSHNIFPRVSKSYIINTSYIESIDIDFIVLHNEEIPLGASYKEDFLERFVKGNLLKR